MAGHEEEDIWLQRGGAAADVTQGLEVAHDDQRASLVDQAGVQRCGQVAH